MAKRSALALIALVLTVITMFGLLPMVLTLVSVPLFSVWIGLPMFLAATAATRVWADGGRWV